MCSETILQLGVHVSTSAFQPDRSQCSGMQCRVFHNNLTHRTSEIHDIHLFKVCHGDIKLENILITSWNWVLLADFASFKPTYLPEDNPGDYSYFFDASRRRTCYIAPERFVFNYCLIHRSVIHKFSSATV